MPTILVRDVLERASTLLDDMDPQFTRWPERELVAWLNDGARALAKWIPQSVSRIDTIRLAAGTRQSIADIPAAGILMGDGSPARRVQGVQLYAAICNMGGDGLTPGRAIQVVERAALDALNPAWHTETGDEVENVITDALNPTSFYVYPAVGQRWLEVSYCALPQNVVIATAGQFLSNSTDATVLPVGDAYADDILNYMLARAYLSRADLVEGQAMASAYTQLFVGTINATVTNLTGNNPNLSMLPFAPTPAGRA